MRANGTFRIGSTVGPVLPTDSQALNTVQHSPAKRISQEANAQQEQLNATIGHNDQLLVTFTLTCDHPTGAALAGKKCRVSRG